MRLTVIGLDFSLGMRIGLGRWFRKLRLDGRMKFHLADMREVPFRIGSFDFVCSSAALEYLPDAQEALAEFCRVLRPGGRLLIITTRRTPLGKPIVLLLRNGAYDQARSARNMREAGFAQVRRLRCCWYSHHVNWWGMTLLGERGRMDPGCSERTEEP